MKYASNDFSKDDLPLNRRKQFFAIYKNEWKTFLLIGLIFLIPLAIYIVLQFMRWGFIANLIDASSSEDIASSKVSMVMVELIYQAILLPIYAGFSVVLAGASRVIQRLVYGEGLLFKGDFFYGIRHNFKHILVFTLIFGLVKALVVFGTSILNTNGGPIESVLSGVLEAIFSFVLVPVLFYACSFSVTYKMKIGQELSNGFKLFFYTLLVPLLFSAILFVFKYLDIFYLSKALVVIPIVEVVFTLVILPILLLIWHLYTTSLFDKHLNENNYKEIYLKGLRDYNYQGEETNEHLNNENN